jgi:hypothetical protein
MASEARNDWDLLAAIAAIIALIMAGVYLWLIRVQGGQVVLWFIVGLAVAALLSMYGVRRAAPLRRLALAMSGVTLSVLGILGLLSIGFPLLVAGVLALIAAALADRVRPSGLVQRGLGGQDR